MVRQSDYPMFCDPQAPWQKGTVENTNNRLRKYLDYRTPAEVFESSLVEMRNRLT